MQNSPELIADAVSAAPLLTPRGVLDRVFNLSFSGFVYNQIWEDPDVDAAAMQLDENSRIMTISSGGCNALNYLCRGVASVDVVDLNAHHLNLLRLKLRAVERFPGHGDFFAFFGDTSDPENLRRYAEFIRPGLDATTSQYWEGSPVRKAFRWERVRYFERGLWKHSSMGTFLRFMHGVARTQKMAPQRLLECQTLGEQERVFESEIAPFFKMPVVVAMAKVPFLLHGLGVPPRQYETFKKEAPEGSVLSEYRKRVRRLACDFPIQTNYFAWQAFGGRYDLERRVAIPDYLREEHFAGLQQNVGRVRTHLTSMTGFLATQPERSLNRFVLLDAQDWMSPDQMTALWRQILRVGQPGSRVIFRSGAAASPVETDVATEVRSHFRYEEEISKRLFALDRSAIYGGFHLYVMN